jgi:GTP-binding protein HflX
MRATLDLAHSKGLKKSDTRKLEKLLHERIPTDKVLTLELAESAAEFTETSGHPVSLVLDRRGQVVNITIGPPGQVDTPELRQVRVGPGRLCGQRIIYTQLTNRRHNSANSNGSNHAGSHGPTREDLQCLAKNRLDLIAKIEVNTNGSFSRSHGEQVRLADVVHIAHLLPSRDQEGKLWKIFPPQTARKVQDISFDELMSSLETEFRRVAPKLQVRVGEERAILAAVIPPERDAWEIEDDLDELAQLTRTAGGTICGRLTQARPQPDPRQFLGSGKAQELALIVQEYGANLVIVDQELTMNQQHELQKIVSVKVIDRTQLILDIFAQRANTKEGKLQVELAQLNYMYPRLMGKGVQLSRLGGGIGTRGPGETKLEVDRRRMRDKMAHLQRETSHIRDYRDTQRRRRNFENLPVAALTGYTNSGKSTLLNALTKSDKLVEDKLFATLDPATRRTVLPDNSPVLFTDTVGFIKKLPPSLFAAFSATLEEVVVADILLHVVDASHPNVMLQITSVLDVLGELHALEKPTITVLNKADKVRKEDLDWLAAQVPNPVIISALHRKGLDKLLLAVQNMFQEVCPYRQRFTA